MKRGTPDHPKTHRLARTLGITRAQAVGHLELLWHWTAKFAPRGDVGRFGDADIEEGAAWEGAAGELVRALQAEGWLDPHQDQRVRLVVHDWHEHADDATKKALARKGLSFIASVSIVCPDNGGQRQTSAASPIDHGGLPLPLPEPEPEPSTTPPPPSTSPEAPPGATEQRRLRLEREELVSYWRGQATRHGLVGPDREARRRVWEALARGLTVRQVEGAIDEQIRDALVASGRVRADSPWPPPEAVADRGPPASADAAQPAGEDQEGGAA